MLPHRLIARSALTVTESMDFTPQNQDFAAVVSASFARQGLMKALGIELAEVKPGACVLVAGHQDALLQQHGYFHGALIGAMLDSAGGYAGHSLMPPGSEVLTGACFENCRLRLPYRHKAGRV